MIYDPNPWAFWLLAAMAVGCALAVVRARKLFHAALALVGTLFAVAGLYGLLQAWFLAAVQVLVYVGAIAIMILFAIMLTHNMMKPDLKTLTTQPWTAAALCLMLLAILLGGTLNSTWQTAPNTTLSSTWTPKCGFQVAEAIPSVQALGFRLLDPFTLPFEMVSVLILVSLIGALVLAHRNPAPPGASEGLEDKAP
jgi:NADH-quinone oxidoreductase subunit J